MATFEEDLEFANKILRARNAGLSNKIMDVDGIWFYKRDSGQIEIALSGEKGFRKSPIMYFDNDNIDTNIYPSYIGDGRIIFNSKSKKFEVYEDGNVYEHLQTSTNEEWHFQQSLICSYPVLRAGMILNTLFEHHMGNFTNFMIITRYLDEFILKLDKAGL